MLNRRNLFKLVSLTPFFSLIKGLPKAQAKIDKPIWYENLPVFECQCPGCRAIPKTAHIANCPCGAFHPILDAPPKIITPYYRINQ